MAKFVNDYVDGCDRCARTKAFPGKPHGPLKPNEVPEGPWQTASVDLIVDLPPSKDFTGQKFDSILVVTDHHSKQSHLIPTVKSVDTAELCDLYLREVWKHHGVPRRMISDCGPQFASELMKVIAKALGQTTSLSSAYHPETDRQTERVNQEVEQYLRLFTSWRQDDWVKFLPTAEFALNSRVHSATGKSPFMLLYGYTPELHVPLRPQGNLPAAEDRLRALKEVQEDARSALQLSKDSMKVFYDRHVKEAPRLKKGDKVWLDAQNVRLKQPSRKLSHKRLGPYEIEDVIGPLNYRLKLPPTVHIHPVFHVSLLSPLKPDRVPGRAHDEPPAIEVEGEEEWEVEEIRDSRLHYGKRQYLVKWVGYDDSHCSWEPVANVKNAKEAVKAFHDKNSSAPRSLARAVFESLPFKPFENFTVASSTPRLWTHGRFKGRASRSEAP
jgi:hypothetical protein